MTRQFWTGGPCSQRHLTKTFDEFGGQITVLDKKAHVDGSIEGVEKQIHVHILAQLAAQDRSAECSVSFLTARFEEAFAEGCDEATVALSGAQHGRNDASAPAAKNFNQLAHLPAHVGAQGAGIGEVEFGRSAVGESVGDQRRFVGPPAINCRFGNAGVSRHSFNGQIREAFLAQ